MASRPQLNQSEVGRVDGSGQRVSLGRWLYDYLLALGRNPDQSVSTPTVGASPFTYTNASAFDQDVYVTGGTVSAVEFSRGGGFYTAGVPVRLSPGDAVRVTYTVAPTINVVPR